MYMSLFDLKYHRQKCSFCNDDHCDGVWLSDFFMLRYVLLYIGVGLYAELYCN